MGSPQQYILGSEMKWTLCLLFVASLATALPTRDKKAFSLFSVVTFPNKECATQMTPPMTGICVTADECQNSGDVVATKSGNCASGFGVCCLRTVEGNPGANINTALTYIQSPDFPAAVTALNNAGTPPAAINRAFNIQGGSNVCQVRFDFDTAVVDGPLAAAAGGNNAGDCSTDSISVTTPARGANTAGIGIRALCGTLTGQHLYVDVNTLVGGAMAATLNINTAATAAARMWKILARCVNCDDEEFRAPSGCAQFHTGASGRISSFNGAPAVANNGQMLLNDLSYSICIRPVAGSCGVTLVEANSPAPGGAAVVPDSFSLGGPAAATAGNSGVGSAECTQSYLEVETTQSLAGAVSPRICGGILNANNDQANAAPVDTVGFTIGVVSEGDNDNAAATGFDLLYSPRGCP